MFVKNSMHRRCAHKKVFDQEVCLWAVWLDLRLFPTVGEKYLFSYLCLPESVLMLGRIPEKAPYNRLIEAWIFRI